MLYFFPEELTETQCYASAVTEMSSLWNAIYGGH